MVVVMVEDILATHIREVQEDLVVEEHIILEVQEGLLHNQDSLLVV
jgi:hypothetical protein